MKDPDFQSRTSLLRRLALSLGLTSVRNPIPTLVLIGVMTGALLPYAIQPTYDDDVIKFLPEGDPEVDRFMEIGKRFEGLAVGIIGVEPQQGTVFERDILQLMRDISDQLPELDGVGFATSLTTIPDIAESSSSDGDTMTDLRDMVGRIPPADSSTVGAFLADVRERALARDHIRGALVSENGDAAMVVVTFRPEAPVKPTAEAIYERVEALHTDSGAQVRIHYGGAPFIGAFVAEEARKDIGRLSPWVALAVILILLITARSIPGTLIALLSVGVSICWVIGLMEASGSPLTLVSSSLPVLLVALGSAYSIHVLTQVLAAIDQSDERPRQEAIEEALRYVTPPVLVAGLTTALAFLSFQVMDIAPMRTFGFWMAGGTILAVLLALSLVPAACTILPLHPREGGRSPQWAHRLLLRSALGILSRPKRVGMIVLIVIGASSFYTAKVDTHMETRAFFEEDSAPVQAEDFLEEKLGGSLFLQVQIAGDIRDPMVLKQIERFEDEAASYPGVTGVQSVALAMRLVNMALSGEPALPVSRERAESLATLASTSDASLKLLVDDAWKHALVAVKLGGFNTEKAGALAGKLQQFSTTLMEPLVAIERERLTPEQVDVERKQIAQHGTRVLLRYGVTLTPEEWIKTLEDSGVRTNGTPSQNFQPMVERQLRNLVGETDDPYVILREDAEWTSLVPPIAEALVSNELTVEKLKTIFNPSVDTTEEDDPEMLQESLAAIAEYIEDAAQSIRIASMTKNLQSWSSKATDPERARAELLRVVSPLFQDQAFLPRSAVPADQKVLRETTLQVDVSGYPMIYAGMNRSVYTNQTRSMLVSFGLVLLALTWFFGRFTLALAASVPAGMTLLMTFGIMGLLNIPMDVGTSMIASIALGVGIDYAVHLVWKYGSPASGEEADALHGALDSTGWGIVINALEVTVGFGLLALGTVVPMQHFGTLTAFAMVASALTTLLLIPGLIRLAQSVHKEASL